MQPAKRIGCGERGVEEIKEHPFFIGTDWDRLLAKEIDPPFIPETKNAKDTRNVDNEFLSEMPAETPMENNMELLKMHRTDKMFEDFSYAGEGLAKKTSVIQEVDEDNEV